MKIVLDTNVLLVSISSRSKYRPILEGFIEEKYQLCVTTDILYEYEEILKRHMGIRLTEYVLQLIENAPNTLWINNYYKWNLIGLDADDNKFVDCSVASGSDFLVSNDNHFNILGKIPYPKINLLKANEFIAILSKHNSK